jgi:hypothetical protein
MAVRTKKGAEPKKTETLAIAAPNFQVASFTIVGTTPLVGNKFSARARAEMRAKMEAGSTAKKGAKRKPKNFKQGYEEAIHRAQAGWCGIPAPAFRNAMISACRVVGFAMTRAKLSVFVLEDGFDSDDGTPLVKITKGKPEYAEHFVRNETGVVDLRPRPMWKEGWEAVVRVRFDADQFTTKDVANLLARAGIQVGLCAGRPDSSKSNGMGWGLFKIKGQKK